MDSSSRPNVDGVVEVGDGFAIPVCVYLPFGGMVVLAKTEIPDEAIHEWLGTTAAVR